MPLAHLVELLSVNDGGAVVGLRALGELVGADGVV